MAWRHHAPQPLVLRGGGSGNLPSASDAIIVPITLQQPEEEGLTASRYFMSAPECGGRES